MNTYAVSGGNVTTGAMNRRLGTVEELYSLQHPGTFSGGL